MEADHYEQRKAELDQFAMDALQSHTASEFHDGAAIAQHHLDAVDSHTMKKRRKKQKQGLPPWKTNPEIRETPPSIGLYSVMFQLPKSMITYDTDGATTMERQLVATTNFFDEIVPAENGFSSSIAAVTMIPKASLVAEVWKKWVWVFTFLILVIHKCTHRCVL